MLGLCGRMGSYKRVGILVGLLFILMVIVIQLQYFSISGSRRVKQWEHFLWKADNINNEGHVKEKRHIAFLKVHKAASSTAQNIFLRFARHRDLLVVMPHVPKFFYPNIISTGTSVTSTNILPPPSNRSYEILCCHVLYDRVAFEKVMPKDTVYIGIIREPFEHFISVLNYFRPGEVLKINDTLPVSKYLQKPTRYTKLTSKSYVNSRMAREFGFPSDLFETRNETGIQGYLEKLESEFELVIIVELFDESLLLMRRLLNWRMSDILYVKKNVKSKLYEKIKFTVGDVDLYKKWSVLDYALYDHFYRRLQNQIRMQGPDFFEELLYFKRLRRDMELYCNPMPGVKMSAVYHFVASRWNSAFTITEEDCHYMHIGETAFITEIRLQQYGFFKDRPEKVTQKQTEKTK